MEDLGNTEANGYGLNGLKKKLQEELDKFSMDFQAWDPLGGCVCLWELRVHAKDWMPVLVQATTLQASRRVSILLSASFRSDQSEYRRPIAALVRMTTPDMWRVRIIPKEQWVDDKGNKLTAEQAVDYYTLKFRTYQCPRNPYGCNVANSPAWSYTQATRARTVQPQTRFDYPASPSKLSSKPPAAQQQKVVPPLVQSCNKGFTAWPLTSQGDSW